MVCEYFFADYKYQNRACTLQYTNSTFALQV